MQDIDRLVRRIKLRDLRMLLAVAQSGSLSKAAHSLAVSHPVVSKTIADLERTLGTRLFGRALADSSIAIVDDLHRGLRQIECLSDPTRGELRIGAHGPAIEGVVLAAIEWMVSRHPGIEIHVSEGDAGTVYRALHERRIDLAIARLFRPTADYASEFASELLFDEHLFVVAASRSQWANRRRIELAELLDSPWVLPEPDTPPGDSSRRDFFRGVSPR